MALLLAGVTLAFTVEAAGAPAPTDSCLEILDDAERLRCYDELSSRDSKEPDSSEPPLSLGFLSDRARTNPEDKNRRKRFGPHRIILPTADGFATVVGGK